ncbi:MAG: sigma-E factor regulatory protein RseB domain-containing protein [bacterium]
MNGPARMIRPALKTLFILVLGGLASGAWGQEAPSSTQSSELDRLLREIQAARTKVRYQAEQVVYVFTMHKTAVSRFQVLYAYPYLKCESTGDRPEAHVLILEDGKHLWRYLINRKIVVKEPLREGVDEFFARDLPENLSLIRKNYDFVIRGPVPVNDDQCRIIEFIPKWQDRPRREIWLEEKRMVPVRVRVSLPDGRTSYMSEMRRICWDPEIKPDSFELKVAEDTRVYEIQEQAELTLEKAQRILKRPIQLPKFVPPGYVPYNIVFRSGGPRKRLQIVYADGLSSFSIFLEWMDRPQQRTAPPSSDSGTLASGPEQGPRIQRFGLINVLTLEVRGQRRIVVGDMQEEKLLETANSLSDAPPAPSASPSSP